jgi:hypothetical protein
MEFGTLRCSRLNFVNLLIIEGAGLMLDNLAVSASSCLR